MESLLATKNPEISREAAHQFVPIEFMRRELKSNASTYHIYRSPVDFVEITAESAHEALKESGIDAAYKIIRFAFCEATAITTDMLLNPEEALAFKNASKQVEAIKEDKSESKDNMSDDSNALEETPES